MKLLFRFLQEKRWVILAFFLFMLLFAGAVLLYRLPLAAALYPAALCTLLGAGFLTAGFFRYRKRHGALMELQKLGILMEETLPEAATLEEEDYQTLVKGLCRMIADVRTADEAAYRDMLDYYTVWVHQIKTPIASMKLRLQNEDTALSRTLRWDLLRIEQYADMVLAFLRLGSESSDYVFREYELDGILRQAARKFAPEFIGRKIRLDYEPTQKRIVTDEKWLQFVVEQLLSNALKYTKEGSIRIAMEGPDTLCVADTGIGIAPEDLPRIFEKGYTGGNGRLDKTASGLGLYLCRMVCTRLGIGISAQSEPGKGTVIRLDLRQHEAAE